MDVAHLVLTPAEGHLPARSDAQRITDGLWAQAPSELRIEHIHARAGPGHIDVVLFLRTAGQQTGIPDKCAVLAAISNLPALRSWNVVFAPSEEDGML